jgi:hypothetical protein
VQLQAAARSLLARRRVQEMRDLQQIKPCTPSQLLQVVLRRVEDFDSIRCIGDLRHTVPPRAVGMLFSPCAPNSKSVALTVGSPLLFSVRCRLAAVRRGEGMVSPAGAHRIAPLHSTAGHREGTSTGRCCDHFQVAIHMNLFRPDGVHGIQEAVHVQVWRANGVHLMFRVKNKESQSILG